MHNRTDTSRAAAPDGHGEGNLPVEELVLQFERETALSTFRFFAVCGIFLGLLLILLRFNAAWDGVEQARRQVFQGVMLLLLTCWSVLMIRSGYYRQAAVAAIVLSIALVCGGIFYVGVGVRGASAPFLIFPLLLSIMVFGSRWSLRVMLVCIGVLLVAVVAEYSAWIPGPVGDNYVPTFINLVCLIALYLFALGFSIYMDRRARMLNDELEGRRAALVAALEQTRQSRGAKERFLASLSTEVQAPLAELMRSIDQVEASQRAVADAPGINGVSVRVRQFLENALGSARRLSPGRHEMDRCSPVQLVASRCDHWARQAQLKGLELVKDFDVSYAPLCMAPADGLYAAVDAILDNAVRYSVRGNVLVKMQCVEQTELTVVWRLLVSDTGTGMPDTVIQRIRRSITARPADGAVNSPEFSSMPESFGGLAIVRQWIDAVEGEVDILSRINEGSIVTLQFELQKA